MKVGDKIYKVYRNEVIDFHVIEKVMPKTVQASGKKFKVDGNRFFLIGIDEYNMYSYYSESENMIRSLNRHNAIEYINTKNIAFFDTDTVLEIERLLKNATRHTSDLLNAKPPIMDKEIKPMDKTPNNELLEQWRKEAEGLYNTFDVSSQYAYIEGCKATHEKMLDVIFQAYKTGFKFANDNNENDREFSWASFKEKHNIL